MTRDTFVAALRDGLAGLPAAVVTEVLRDYEAHIAEAESRGRSESEVVAALGDPERIARELRAEIRVRAWQTKRDPVAAMRAIFALVGMGAIDLALIAPVFVVAFGVIAASVLTALGMIGAGVLLSFAAANDVSGIAFPDLFALAGSDVRATSLLALSLVSGAVAGVAGSLLLAIAVVNGTVWYGRLHYRVIRLPKEPVVDPQTKKFTVIGS